MTSLFVSVALDAALRALHQTRDLLIAAKHYQAAEFVIRAGWLVENAIGHVVVDKCKSSQS